MITEIARQDALMVVLDYMRQYNDADFYWDISVSYDELYMRIHNAEAREKMIQEFSLKPGKDCYKTKINGMKLRLQA
jgi:hypothetical protein